MDEDIDKIPLEDEYRELLTVSPDEELLVLSSAKLAKIFLEIHVNYERQSYNDIDSYEALTRLSFLLSEVSKIKKEIDSRL